MTRQPPWLLKFGYRLEDEIEVSGFRWVRIEKQPDESRRVLMLGIDKGRVIVRYTRRFAGLIEAHRFIKEFRW